MDPSKATEGATGEPVAPQHKPPPERGDSPSGEEPLRAQVQELTQRAERLLANWQRAQADLANYRKQVEREREELALMANAGLTADLLPILDDLERAMSTVAPELRAYTWVDGVWFIAKKLEALLAAHGLEEVKAQGQPFDPQQHQAVAEAEGEPGQVLKVAQKGYRLRSLLLRPTLVTVGKRSSPEGAAKAAPGGGPRETQGEPPKAAA